MPPAAKLKALHTGGGQNEESTDLGGWCTVCHGPDLIGAQPVFDAAAPFAPNFTQAGVLRTWADENFISALLALNGVGWFFFGPESVGASLEEFGQVNPIIAWQMVTNARQVAIWYLAFGLLALLVTREGLRHRPRWAWYATWIEVAVLAAIGLLYRDGFGVFVLGLVPFALAGQLLAGKDLSSHAIEADEAAYDRIRP